MRTLATCLLLAVLLGLSGCGESDSEADGFSEGYNAAIERLGRVNQELAGLEASSRSRSNRAIGRAFDRFAEAVESTRGDLARLEPPERAAQEFAGLLAALDESVSASRRAAAAARAIKPARQRRAVLELRRATGAISGAEDALSRAVETTG